MAATPPTPPVLGTQIYPLTQYYTAKGSTLDAHLDEAFTAVAAAGLTAVELAADSKEQIDLHVAAAKKAGLVMPSFYQNARLHESDTWRANADKVVELALIAKAASGAKIANINPEPVRWGGNEDKDDAQLRIQTGALRYLNDTLRMKGITLAYHTHDPEMRQGAREFHHAMLSTADKPMKWCLDTHWIYRGCGNSNVALEDVIKLYGPRIALVHLRQSAAGVWSETFGDGDVEHRNWVAQLRAMQYSGPIYLEQCSEPGTPDSLPLQDRLTQSTEFLKKLLGL